MLFKIYTILLTVLAYANSDPEAKLAQCGGAIVSDGDAFSYPGPGESFQPGELCVWTIHLDTLNDFKINFSNFSINSNESGCTEAGVRIYSLTNLVAPNDLPSYTFCNTAPPAENFFLAGNIAVLILYVNSPNANEGSGFTVSWTGIKYDNMMTQHVSTFSSAASGLIGYPVVGSYEPNLAATWLIKSEMAHQAMKSDIQLNKLNLESCSSSVNPCFCDALILYEISPQGMLNETQRFCQDTVDASLQSLESRFIVAFFTDFRSETAEDKNGFDLVYYPHEEIATTEESHGPVSKNCGDVIGEEGFGRIAYEFPEGETYDFLNCFWTIRIRNVASISFELISSDLVRETNDFLVVTTFNRSPDPLLDHHNFKANASSTVTLEGNLAIVSFYSDEHTNHTRGFVLNYKGVGESNIIISNKSRSVITDSGSGIIRHPVDSVDYDRNELSTFMRVAPNFRDYYFVDLTITFKGLDGDCQRDFIQVYILMHDTYDWRPYKRYCGDVNPYPWWEYLPLLYVFVSEELFVGPGFYIEWTKSP